MAKLVVGLGNPGTEYSKTRHNAGFLFVDGWLSSRSAEFSYQSKFQGSVVKFNQAGQTVHVLKPQTFMNKSGVSVATYAKYFNISVEDIIVVHDELDLEPGDIRLKRAGGHGGHNGLRDIINQLSSADFYRLRIGVGHPGAKHQVSNYVLTAPGKEDDANMLQAMAMGVAVMDDVLKDEYQRAMQYLHTAK
ncbi:MAG: aminoacyl-tRNA hydrolase [Piscirickettsiaceae bacterium]|nr:MAG: aminoacyl-tRNA hydrolase [Piscirickettsiaceae bacterium]PCI70521.1 MAG: aminoacyl-tRNA hydrolase [Piscirickettsiaceae bacterium]